MFFLRKAKQQEQLPVTMSGVRMGERVLQVGIDDPAIAGAIAAKVGLSGQAAIVVADDAAGASARSAVEKAGVLADVQVAPLHALPVPSDSFDLVVLHARSGWLSALDAAARQAILVDVHRVLRGGGRAVVIERPGGNAADALSTAGFRASRVLAERDGYLFAEGLKPRP